MHYRGFVGPGSVLGASPPVSLTSVTNANGASNTLVIVDAAEPVPWTKPEEPGFNETGPLGLPGRHYFLALFADGHAQTLPQVLDRKTIRRTINWQNTIPVMLP